MLTYRACQTTEDCTLTLYVDGAIASFRFVPSGTGNRVTFDSDFIKHDGAPLSVVLLPEPLSAFAEEFHELRNRLASLVIHCTKSTK